MLAVAWRPRRSARLASGRRTCRRGHRKPRRRNPRPTARRRPRKRRQAMRRRGGRQGQTASVSLEALYWMQSSRDRKAMALDHPLSGYVILPVAGAAIGAMTHPLQALLHRAMSTPQDHEQPPWKLRHTTGLTMAQRRNQPSGLFSSSIAVWDDAGARTSSREQARESPREEARIAGRQGICRSSISSACARERCLNPGPITQPARPAHRAPPRARNHPMRRQAG